MALHTVRETVHEILSSDTPTFLSGEQLAAMDEIITKACRELAPGWDPTPFVTL